MKVVLLAPTPPPYGGIAEWTQRMINAKLKNGWDVCVVDEKVSEKRGAYTTKRNLVEECKRCFKIWHDLKKAVQNEDTGVVHCCIPATTYAMLRELVSANITRRYKKKFIIHFRCTVPNMVKSKIGHFVLKILCKKSDYIIALNGQTEFFLRKITNVDIKIIPNFVTDEEINNTNICKINDELKKVIYVGGVMPSKGCDDIIRIAKKCPKIEFEMIGKIDDSILNTIVDTEIENVNLLGAMHHDEVIKKMKSSDVFIFLTHYDGEGFSNALCEAMAIGLPCIVTDWAANADMIDDGKGGYVVPVNNYEAAIKALEEMNSVEVRKKQSKYNIEKVKMCYSENVVLDQYVDIYELLTKE